MNIAFVDTQYFVAIFQESDQWYERAKEVEIQIIGYNFVTTDTVLCEVLNYFCAYGEETRQEVSSFIAEVLDAPNFQVVEQISHHLHHETFPN